MPSRYWRLDGSVVSISCVQTPARTAIHGIRTKATLSASLRRARTPSRHVARCGLLFLDESSSSTPTSLMTAVQSPAMAAIRIA